MSLRAEVFDLDQGRCVGCGHKMARGGDAWSWQCHHALKVQWLRARGCQPKWWRGPALAVLLCRECHMQHEARAATVPLERLPERVHRSVAILGPWSRDLLLRYHPPESFAIEDRGYQTACWVWSGGLTPKGYATTSRREGGKTVTWRAHRLFWHLANGPLPDDLEIDHLCRVRACVNPEHMEPVTHTENMRRASNTKLTIEDAHEIRRRHTAARAGRGKAPNGTIIALAAEFGVSRATIHDALARSWR